MYQKGVLGPKEVSILAVHFGLVDTPCTKTKSTVLVQTSFFKTEDVQLQFQKVLESPFLIYTTKYTF